MLPHTEGRGDLLSRSCKLRRRGEQVTPALGVLRSGVLASRCAAVRRYRERCKTLHGVGAAQRLPNCLKV